MIREYRELPQPPAPYWIAEWGGQQILPIMGADGALVNVHVCIVLRREPLAYSSLGREGTDPPYFARICQRDGGLWAVCRVMDDCSVPGLDWAVGEMDKIEIASLPAQ